MKFICKLFVFFFLAFLAAPTIVSLIDDEVEMSFFYNIEEDENTISLDEIKSITTIYSIPLIFDFEGCQKIKFGVLSDTKVTSITPNIFLPPPKLI